MVDTAYFPSEERFWLRKNKMKCEFHKLALVYVIALNYIIEEILLIAKPIGMNTHKQPIPSLIH